MSRSKKKKKKPGYEYWSKRPISRNCGANPGKETKNQTHRLERLEAKKQIKQGLKDDEEKETK
jgi:hypothetical protein